MFWYAFYKIWSHNVTRERILMGAANMIAYTSIVSMCVCVGRGGATRSVLIHFLCVNLRKMFAARKSVLPYA